MGGRAANGEGSLYRHGEKWKASVTVGKRPDGNPITRTKTHKTKAVVAEWRRQMIAELQAGEPGSDMQFCDWVTTWLKDVEKTKSTNTFQGYRDSIERFAVPTLGKLKLSEIRPMTVRNLLESLEPLYAETRTLDMVYEVLKTCLMAAAKMELIDSNPVSKIPRPKYSRSDIHPFTVREVRLILKASQSHRLHGLMVCAFHLGLRAGELFGLHWSDLDWEKRTLRIERQATAPRGKLEIKSPKTKAGRRTLELPDVVLESLADRQALALKEKMARNPIIFPGARGAYLHGNTFSKRHWKPILRKCGVEERGMHHARHTFATHALIGGEGIEPSPLHVVSKILGHASPSVTLNIYSHLVESVQVQTIERVAKLFAG